MVTVVEVMKAFVCGREARSRSVWTDGKLLWSMGEPIAKRQGQPDGSTVVEVVRKQITATSARHVTMLLRLVKRVVFSSALEHEGGQ